MIAVIHARNDLVEVVAVKVEKGHIVGVFWK